MLIKTDPDTIKAYFEDSSNLKGGHADAVAFPENIESLADILRKANSGKTPVTILGGGTGTTGGRVPFGGLAVSMERFDRILNIDRERLSATVEAGVRVEDFKESCEREGLFYTCHPTEKTAFVGGTVATNASGARSFRYGPTRRYVRRLKMVLPGGDIFDIKRGERRLTKNDPVLTLPGGRRIHIPLPSYSMPGVKNSAGYFAKNGMDGIDLFIGQEGTLSVITEIEFALVKKPANIFSAFIFFRDEKDALAFSAELKTSAKGPARPPDGMTGGLMSLEYFDSNALDLLKPKRPDIPVSAQAAIFIEEEVTKEGEGPAAERLSGLITRHKALLDETWVSMNREEADKFIELRHAVPEAVNDIVRKNGFQKISTDLAVPDDKFPDMMDFYNGEFRKNGLEHVIFGHIGESHVHVNLLPRTVEDMETAKGTALAFARRAVALGGTVSAEHGIGKLKHRYLEEMYGLSGISDMVRVKKALDPNCVLGLDNIFPRESLKKA